MQQQTIAAPGGQGANERKFFSDLSLLFIGFILIFISQELCDMSHDIGVVQLPPRFRWQGIT